MKTAQQIKDLADLVRFFLSNGREMGEDVKQHKVYTRNNKVYLVLDKTNFLPFNTIFGVYDTFDEFYSLVVKKINQLKLVNDFTSKDIEAVKFIDKHLTVKII